MRDKFTQAGRKGSTVTASTIVVAKPGALRHAGFLAYPGSFADTAPEIDAVRVAEARSAVASGAYRIDATRIADALLRADRQLG